MSRPERDLLITAIETNNHHGVGIFLQRLFPDSQEFVCLRTTSLYAGEEPFGGTHHELCSRFLRIAALESHLKAILELYTIRRIICVPYYREEFLHGAMAKRLTGAPLCTFLMDDQNVFAREVPDHRVNELLALSDLRLGISAEMCAAYQRKYGHAFHLLPPIVEPPAYYLPNYWQPDAADLGVRAAMIGNVWTRARFVQLIQLLRETGLELDWYGNGSAASWLTGSPDEWEMDGLHCMGYLPEEDLVAALASYPFVLIPGGTADEQDDNPAFSQLSLPSRLTFLHARCDTPVLVLGSRHSALGRFVTRHQTGLCAAYLREDLLARARELSDPETRGKIRARIGALAPKLVMPNAGQWIWRALATGSLPAAPFQDLFQEDYLDEASGLHQVRPVQAAVQYPNLVISEPLLDSQMQAWGIIETGHLDLARGQGITIPPLEELEAGHAASAVCRVILNATLPNGGDVLFLGDHWHEPLQHGDKPYRLWRIMDLPAWQKAGYAGDPAHVRDCMTHHEYGTAFPQFDAIISTGWCGQLPDDPHALEGLALFLGACVRPGGLNFHAFSAVLHPTYHWVGPAHDYLKQRYMANQAWPGRDELLACSKLFIMSEAAHAKFWQPATGKSSHDFGAVHLQTLFWRK